jgi:hypothetical protein
MEAAENCASHDLAVLGKGMFVVILQRWEYRGTFRNPPVLGSNEDALGAKQLETLAMPSNQRLGFDEDQGLFPIA